jgi:hypothetical protein
MRTKKSLLVLLAAAFCVMAALVTCVSPYSEAGQGDIGGGGGGDSPYVPPAPPGKRYVQLNASYNDANLSRSVMPDFDPLGADFQSFYIKVTSSDPNKSVERMYYPNNAKILDIDDITLISHPDCDPVSANVGFDGLKAYKILLEEGTYTGITIIGYSDATAVIPAVGGGIPTISTVKPVAIGLYSNSFSVTSSTSLIPAASFSLEPIKGTGVSLVPGLNKMNGNLKLSVINANGNFSAMNTATVRITGITGTDTASYDDTINFKINSLTLGLSSALYTNPVLDALLNISLVGGYYELKYDFIVNGQFYPLKDEVMHIYGNMDSIKSLNIPLYPATANPTNGYKVIVDYVDSDSGTGSTLVENVKVKELLKKGTTTVPSTPPMIYFLGDNILYSDIRTVYTDQPKHSNPTYVFDNYYKAAGSITPLELDDGIGPKWRFVGQAGITLANADKINGDTTIYMRWKKGSTTGLNIIFNISDPLITEANFIGNTSGFGTYSKAKYSWAYGPYVEGTSQNTNESLPTYNGNYLGPITVGNPNHIIAWKWEYTGALLSGGAGTSIIAQDDGNPGTDDPIDTIVVDFFELQENRGFALNGTADLRLLVTVIGGGLYDAHLTITFVP